MTAAWHARLRPLLLPLESARRGRRTGWPEWPHREGSSEGVAAARTDQYQRSPERQAFGNNTEPFICWYNNYVGENALSPGFPATIK